MDIHVSFDDPAWPELMDRPVINLPDDGAIGMTGIRNATDGGAPAIIVRLDLPDGQVVLAGVTLRLLLAATAALSAHYGHELDVDQDMESVGVAVERWRELLKRAAERVAVNESPSVALVPSDVFALNELVSFAGEWHGNVVEVLKREGVT